MYLRPAKFDTIPFTVVNDPGFVVRVIQLLMIPALLIDTAVALLVDIPWSQGILLVVVPALVMVGAEVILRTFAPRWRKEFTIDSTMVVCAAADGGWSEPVSHYRDVLWHEVVRGSGKNRTTYQVVDLRHKTDPRRTVTLVNSRSKAGIRQRWEAVAKGVELPAARDLGGGKIVERDPAELDLSIRQLVEKGSLKDDFDPLRETPSGIRWHRQGASLQVRIRRAPPFYLVILFCISVFGGFLMFTSDGDLYLIIGVFVVLFVVAVYALLHQYRLVIEGPDLHLSGRVLGLPLGLSRHLAMNTIENVNARNPGSMYSMLLIESDDKSLSLGPVSSKAGQWLEKFLISAIANAPRQ